MRKVVIVALCLAVPGLIFLNAWQGWRYSELTSRIADLERQQKDLLAANRDIIGQIAYETSPERVSQKAAALGLVPEGSSAPVTRLRVASQIVQDAAGSEAIGQDGISQDRARSGAAAAVPRRESAQ